MPKLLVETPVGDVWIEANSPEHWINRERIRLGFKALHLEQDFAKLFATDLPIGDLLRPLIEKAPLHFRTRLVEDLKGLFCFACGSLDLPCPCENDE